MKPSVVAGGVVGVVIVVLVVMFAVGGGHNRGAQHRFARFGRAGSAARPQPDRHPVAWPVGPRRLAYDINRAQQVIDDRGSPSGDLATAGLFEQLATGALARETPDARRTTLALLRPPAAATMRTDLLASAALSALSVPEKQFPPWRIAPPLGTGTLLGYFREAQSRFGVGWQYLAAIEFIETRFGRIHGPSSAGAQGPMQFLPATWARYGSGNIDSQRGAILAAARYLVASGAPGDMAGALYHYNNSSSYVAAVQDYAGRMRTDPRAYDGYYNWQVLYPRVGGLFILPIGYPRARPEPVHNP
jgi:hypothetical protein